MTEQPAALPVVFDASTTAFEAEVIDASFDTPILVNLWSPRSPVSPTLNPLLEKVVNDFHGSVRLAHVDVDAEPRVAQMFQLRNVPTVVLMSQGQPLDGFGGALPEEQLIEFLTRHVQPAVAPVAIDETADTVEAPEMAVARLRELIAADPEKAELRLDLAVALMQTGASDEAATLLDTLPANLETDDRAKRARGQLEFARVLVDAPSAAQLQARIDADERDFEARDLLGVRLLVGGDAAGGLEQFLAILRADRNWNDAGAKKRLIAAFSILDDADLVGIYRRKMSSLLF